MKKEQRDKVAFICFLAASLCYFVSAIIGILTKDNSNWVVNLCLGSAFLCLSTTHLNKNDGQK